MNAALLLRIEARRNIGLWVWPLFAGLALLLAYGDGLAWKVTFWVQASVLVRDGLLIVGPAVGGAAAWMGGRERRRKIDDLLATTPRPAWARWGVTWAATALWGLLAYGAAGAYVFVLALRHTDWGAPVIWPMLVGLVAIPTYGAVGYALGALLPSRFTAPLVAIVLAALQAAVGWGVRGMTTFGPATRPSSLGALHYLSPVANLDSSVWYGVLPRVGWPQALFLLGLTGLALGALALRDRRDRVAWGALLAGGVLSGTSVTLLLVAAPPSADLIALSQVVATRNPYFARYDTLIPYRLVCAGTPVPVCVHPAYRSYLAAEAPVINRLLAPLHGLPGVPTRAEQRPHGDMGIVGTVLTFVPNNGNSPNDQFFYGPVAQALVAGGGYGSPTPQRCPGDRTLESCFKAQEAIGIWLVRQAGLRLSAVNAGGTMIHPYFGVYGQATQEAARRFAALGRERQRAWLRVHYLALRRGEVPFKELP